MSHHCTCTTDDFRKWLNLHNRKTWISLGKKRYHKMKNAIFTLLWKALWISVFLEWLIFRVRCTLKLTLREFVHGLGSARSVSIFLRLLFMLVSLSFTKEFFSWAADRSLRNLYIRVAFVWKRLVSRVFHFKLFSTSADLTSYEEPVITLPALFWIFCNLSFSCLPHVSDRGEQ